MRFLIAFILLFSLNFSVANATENKTNAVLEKAGLKKSFSSKKEVHSLNEPLYELIDRIHQNINHHVLAIATFVNSDVSFKSTSIQIIKVFRKKINHSYQALFKHLFPKHTFW